MALTVEGQSFVLHQIRKMVGMMVPIVKGIADTSLIDKCYRFGKKFSTPLAPGFCLVLIEVRPLAEYFLAIEIRINSNFFFSVTSNFTTEIVLLIPQLSGLVSREIWISSKLILFCNTLPIKKRLIDCKTLQLLFNAL